MRKSVFLLVLLLNLSVGFSQANLLNTRSSVELEEVSKLEEGAESRPLDYAKVSDEDIVFSYTTWEVIDLNERVNFPFLYPIDLSTVTPDRKPLIYYLIEGIKNYEFPAFFNDTFTEEISEEEFENIQVYKVLKPGIDADGITEGKEHFDIAGSWRAHLESLGYEFPEEEWVTYDPSSPEFLELEDNEKVVSFQRKWNAAAASIMPDTDFNSAEFEYADVRKYIIKGVWYFDRIATELKFRPIAIGPVALSAEDKFEQTNDDTGGADDSGDDGGFGAFFDDEPEEEVAEEEVVEDESETDSFTSMSDEPAVDSEKEYTPMFWVFYPEARDVLSQAYAFNQKNMSKPFSFDRLINSRRFSGTIYKEANVYQDRDIRDYISKNALMQLLESDRIKEKIRNKEQDMWSY
ncbi:gliding motility protein GldN [Flavobacteriaceae bacterium]|nr:gliding motility protein GldN [Flavobacteriaceae bacterium]